jgi:hypothetical protein
MLELQDQLKRRDRYDSLNKVFSDPQNGKFVKWQILVALLIFFLGLLLFISRFYSNEATDVDDMRPEVYMMFLGAYGFRLLWRVRTSRKQYGRNPEHILAAVLRVYGEPSELQPRIDAELQSETTIFLNNFVLTDNWIIITTRSGFMANVIRLDEAIYIVKGNEYSYYDSRDYPGLYFFNSTYENIAATCIECSAKSAKEVEFLDSLLKEICERRPHIKVYGFYKTKTNPAALMHAVEENTGKYITNPYHQ